MIDFRTTPERYRHWRLSTDGALARLSLDVDEGGGLLGDYPLKLNSYDLGVDIELYDAIQRLRFEHPEVGAVVIESGKARVFCAGANIRMLGGASHGHKVNFCKFTNETRNAIEDASVYSAQTYLCAINGTAAGGGYELAMATEHIVLIDDGSAAVSLPEVPLLAVLPGTGGLTRLVDKRRVRRDLADVFCTLEEGVRGQRALDWQLVDEIAPASRFAEAVTARADELAARGAPRPQRGIKLTALARDLRDGSIEYRYLGVELDRAGRIANLTLRGPDAAPPADAEGLLAQGADCYPLALARELDDALLHLRFNEPTLGTLVFRTGGDSDAVWAYDTLLSEAAGHWFVREIVLYWKRTLKRIDVTSRTSVALVEPGGCFSGLLAELLFAVDRSYMLDGDREDDPRPPATLRLGPLNFGPLPMANGLTRLATRFYGAPEKVAQAETLSGETLDARAALAAGLVTFAPDDIDWDDEIRLFLEERASFSPDALTGLEANLRFPGPETLETKIFGRLSAWQNWIFQRPNAVGDHGALRAYGTGKRPGFDRERV